MRRRNRDASPPPFEPLTRNPLEPHPDEIARLRRIRKKIEQKRIVDYIEDVVAITRKKS